ncbi:MAG: M14 family metallopeptidase [Nanoarchaeota archaeon]
MEMVHVRIEDLLGPEIAELHNAAAPIRDDDPYSRRIGNIDSTIRLGITACVHGNEPVGKAIIDWLLKHQEQFAIEVRYSIGNPFATLKQIRDTGTNMNRVFPGKLDGCYEERQAHRVMQAMAGVTHYIDFHSTTRASPPFATFVDGHDAERLIQATGLEHVLVYPAVESGMGYKGMVAMQAIADAFGASAISVECGGHTVPATFEMGVAIIKNVLRYYNAFDGEPARITPQYYYVDAKVLSETESDMRINPALQECQLVKKGTILAYGTASNIVADCDFYPLLIDYYLFQRENGSLMIQTQRREPIIEDINN